MTFMHCVTRMLRQLTIQRMFPHFFKASALICPWESLAEAICGKKGASHTDSQIIRSRDFGTSIAGMA